MSKRLFGTDGVRGRWGEEPLTTPCIQRLGAAIGHTVSGVQQASRAKAAPRILIGRDTRASGPEIIEALAPGLAQHGLGVFDLGVIPTPGVAYCVRNLGAAAGIMISASHNPARDNGIKVFGPDGFKLAEDLESSIEALYHELEHEGDLDPVTPQDARQHSQAYIDHLISNGRVYGDAPLSGKHIVVDCANGSASPIAAAVFEALGAKVTAIFDQPDGHNINDGCGALHPEVLAAKVVELGADGGATFDGDADRVMLISEEGHVLDGDYMLLEMAEALDERDALPGKAVVSTIMANLGLELALKERGLKLIRTPVGDKYVAAELLLQDMVLGGEQSGHIIHLSRGSTTGDGLFNAITMLCHGLADQHKLSDMEEKLTKSPQVLVNVRVREKPPLTSLDAVQNAVRNAENALGEEGRIVLRYSGTEALARVMVEGLDQSAIEGHAKLVADAIRSAIGAEA